MTEQGEAPRTGPASPVPFTAAPVGEAHPVSPAPEPPVTTGPPHPTAPHPTAPHPTAPHPATSHPYPAAPQHPAAPWSPPAGSAPAGHAGSLLSPNGSANGQPGNGYPISDGPAGGHPLSGQPIGAPAGQTAQNGWARPGSPAQAAPVRPGTRPIPPPPSRIILPPSMRPPAVIAPAPGVKGGTVPVRGPSGLFPSGPPRPTYREPVPVRPGAVTAGAAASAMWMLLFGLLGGSLTGYQWWTFGAGTVAWAVATLLARFGDRGVAVGVAISTGVGVAIAAVTVFARMLSG